jgi:hypothetical protein
VTYCYDPEGKLPTPPSLLAFPTWMNNVLWGISEVFLHQKSWKNSYNIAIIVLI